MLLWPLNVRRWPAALCCGETLGYNVYDKKTRIFCRRPLPAKVSCPRRTQAKGITATDPSKMMRVISRDGTGSRTRPAAGCRPLWLCMTSRWFLTLKQPRGPLPIRFGFDEARDISDSLNGPVDLAPDVLIPQKTTDNMPVRSSAPTPRRARSAHRPRVDSLTRYGTPSVIHAGAG